MTSQRVARVLIDSPLPQLDRVFDYAIPEALAAEAQPGVRVKVPLRTAGRVIDGYIVEIAEQDAADRPLSELEAVVSPVPVLTPGLYRLARRAADRAAGSAGDILRLAIPKRMVRAEKSWLAAGDPSAPEVDEATRAWADGALGAFPGIGEAMDRDERLAVDAPPSTVRLPDGGEVGSWAMLLAAAAVRTLSRGRSAIIVVPDHRDRAQLEAALAGRVAADALVRDDSQQSSPVRYAAFLRTLAAVPCIVIGNRSAVYAPVHRLGLVALWDDGDPLLAEQLSPGVHARDAALLRQELDGGALVFAGHTRTTDVERLVMVGWVREARAARRASPRVVLSATREGESRGARVPSAAFAAAREALATGPVLVQVARPGYAPVLVCAECRHPARCPHCGGPLHASRQGAVPECSWCGRAAANWTCPECSSTRVRMASAGSERTADELGRAFPGTRVIVADGAHPITNVDARPALVVATRGAEPIASGGYRAVILLDGDRMLLADDLRIGESCLRWWSNAAALASAGAPVHLVGVAGPVARALATWTQPAYARAELADRAPLRMPPTVRVASLEGERRAVVAALDALRDAVPALDDEAVLGPVDTGAGVRALVRFDYGLGAMITERLRASVVAEALKTRRRKRAACRPAQYTQSSGRPARPRPVRKRMRLVFAGTPEPAVPALRRLAASDHEIVAVVTRRDAPLGRKRVLTPSPVATAAAELGIEVIRADRLDADATSRISELEPDLGVIVAYGGLVREPLLSAPAHGWINLHFSLLPRWRGAAPVQHALIAGDDVTGASVFQLVPELDAGDVFAERAHHPAPDSTAGDLLAALADEGAELLARVVDDIATGTAVASPQQGAPTFAPKLADDDGRLHWTEPQEAVLGRFRGVTPEPGAHTTIDGARVKVLGARPAPAGAPMLAPGEIALHDRTVIVGTAGAPVMLDRVQPAGKSAMAASDWWRGLRAQAPVAGS